MCNVAGMAFGAAVISPEEVRGKQVLEVGSRNVNGGLRRIFQAWKPAAYTGVDIERGEGVDVVCRIEELESRFGAASFDLVICTEVLEHVRDWRRAIANLKAVARPGAPILLTTRSKGFPFHAFPYDFWRFEVDDMRRIFADCAVEALESDTSMPGVFVKARKPADFAPRALDDVAVFSMVTGAPARELSEQDFASPHYRKVQRKERLLATLTKVKRAIFPDPYATPSKTTT